MSRGNKTYPKQITIYATAEELDEIEERASGSSAASRSRYVVRAAVEGEIIEVTPPPGAGAGQVIEALRALKEEVEKITYEINSAGVNLNEVLKKIHAAREYEIIPAQELRHAAEQVARAAQIVAEQGGAIQQTIDREREEAQRRERLAIEHAKSRDN